MSTIFRACGFLLRIPTGVRSIWLWWRHPGKWWSEYYIVHDPSMLELLENSDWRKT